ILLTAGSLIVDSLRLRWLLDRAADADNPAYLFRTRGPASGLQRLIPLARRADGGPGLNVPWRPSEARAEVARLCYIGAARTHFFSALIVLAAIVVLGAAQQQAPLLLLPGPIPTIPAGLVIAGLVLLAVLARIAVDVTIEPLIEAVGNLS